jgi:hypothetical protein
MAQEIKKSIRLTPDLDRFIKELSQQLKMSENDTIKMIIFMAKIKVI